MRTRAPKPVDSASTAVAAALAAPARSLSRPERVALESRLGGDLSPLRVHEGAAAERAAAALGARGFAIGRHVALGRVARPDTLAHEAAHALQQDMAEPSATILAARADAPAEAQARAAAAGAAGPVTGGRALALACDLTDPGRLGAVHQAVRVQGPPAGDGSSPRQPWVDGPVSDPASTAHLLYNEIFNFLDRREFTTPRERHTTDANLDIDAVAMHQRVIAYFSQIPSILNDAEIQDRVSLFRPSVIANDSNYLNAWMDNNINQMSPSMRNYQINPANTHYRAMITQLLNDQDVGPKLLTLASNQSGFIRGDGTARQIFVHPKVTAAQRQPTLIHEIIHLYRHQRYRDWVNASRDVRVYDEGITEWLALRVMTPTERTERSSYAARVQTVQDQIAQHVSEDDIARAFFRGEVWRLETRGPEARAAFAADTGIRDTGTRSEEIAGSRTSAGLFQSVVPGQHYRFLNLGVAEAEPKPEHQEAFRGVKTSQFDPNPAVKLRFVGHASSPGSDSYNLTLSLRRSIAFYRMARREGVPWNRLLDADRPPHFGESRPSATEEDVITRAMNRRVEMFLVRGATP